MNYRITSGTMADALAAEDRLDGEQAGFGPAFAALFRAAVEAVVAAPRQYSPTEDGPDGVEAREFFIRRFEYRLIYGFDADEIVFLALVHARRRSGSWVRRLSDLHNPEGSPP